MFLNRGTRLGPYEIVSSIRAGGMGEVYRAMDTRLSREVAIKVLPLAFSTDAERLRRFEQEARAAGSLNHPNILVIYDVGTDKGSPYVVAELLEGETLRDRLGNAPLSVRKALDYALQVAHGLAAAHDKGIVHRDLKPENIFITKDGRAKILDFGLAKLTAPKVASASGPEAPTIATMHTEEGMVVGTVNYMSPEQVRGRAVDYHSDIFSFGSILLEMLTGQRTFRGESGVEIMNAILKEDPFEAASYSRILDPAVERIVRHCLEKSPEERFQSARDLAFALATLSGLSGQTTSSSFFETKRRRSKRPLTVVLAGTLLHAAVAVGAFLMGTRAGSVPQPSYHQLTFNRGRIHSARFAPGGDTLAYTAAWGGNPIDTFTMRTNNPESRTLGLESSLLLSISSSGELAILLRPQYLYQFISRGTLARMPLGGGSPREVLENVQGADWSPDGTNLAVVRWVSGRNRLEYPVGTTLYETAGYVSDLRVSPDGKMIAFHDHQLQGDNRGTVAFVDLAGTKTTLTAEFASAEGLAWSPTGDEIWFTASKAGEATALFAVTHSGKQRLVATAPAYLLLRDISRDGRVLLTCDNDTSPIISMAPGEVKERDLTWLNFVRVNDLSPDGKTLIFVHSGEGSGSNYTAYLRKTDGSPAVRLGEGDAKALSPDARQVLSIMYSPPRIVLLPTGAGQPRRLERYGIDQYDGSGAGWLPNGRQIVFWGREPGQNQRSYLQDIDGGPPRPITPEGFVGRLVSPDGQFVIAEDTQQNKFLCSIEGGEPRRIPGLTAEDFIARWTSDPGAVYIYRRGEFPVRVYRLFLATGRKELFRELIPSDPAGIVVPVRVLLTPDGKGYVYAFGRQLSDLYVVDGLK